MKASEDTIRELLKVKLESQRDLQKNFFQAVSLYLILSGGLLKFGVAENDITARLALLSAGMIFSIGEVYSVRFGEDSGKKLDNEISNLNEQLGSPLLSTIGTPLISVLKIIKGTCVISALGFFLLISHTPESVTLTTNYPTQIN